MGTWCEITLLISISPCLTRADSCGEHNPLATSFVKLLANALQSEFQQVG